MLAWLKLTFWGEIPASAQQSSAVIQQKQAKTTPPPSLLDSGRTRSVVWRVFDGCQGQFSTSVCNNEPRALPPSTQQHPYCLSVNVNANTNSNVYYLSLSCCLYQIKNIHHFISYRSRHWKLTRFYIIINLSIAKCIICDMWMWYPLT